MDYPSDFKEFIELLNEIGVEYLVVGGYAVAYHGYPRYTGDIDIWFKATAANVSKLQATLEAFGFGSLSIKADDLLAPQKVIQLGYPPQRIDLMNYVDGVDFDSCFERKVIGVNFGIPISYISLADLKANKLATNRYKDLDDLEHL